MWLGPDDKFDRRPHASNSGVGCVHDLGMDVPVSFFVGAGYDAVTTTATERIPTFNFNFHHSSYATARAAEAFRDSVPRYYSRSIAILREMYGLGDEYVQSTKCGAGAGKCLRK